MNYVFFFFFQFTVTLDSTIQADIYQAALDLQLHKNHTCPILRLIIWQASRAGSMQRILCSDWLPEWARWSDTACPGLPVSFPQIKFRQSSSECTKVFFSPKLLSAKVKRFFVISLSLWNQKKRQRE